MQISGADQKPAWLRLASSGGLELSAEYGYNCVTSRPLRRQVLANTAGAFVMLSSSKLILSIRQNGTAHSSDAPF